MAMGPAYPVEVDADGAHVGGPHGRQREEAVFPVPSQDHPLVVAEELLDPAGHASHLETPGERHALTFVHSW